ncbi:hypothetical protein JCM8097_007190 [Rhodosporidiobolus ruineniae]
MSEVIDQVQQRVFAVHARDYQREKAAGRPAFATPKNVLALGYRLSNDRTRDMSQARGQRGPNIVNVFPNTIITSLSSSSAWETLLTRIGPDALIHLFSHPDIAVLTALPNDCYLQVSGVPLADLPLLDDGPGAASSAQTLSDRPVHERRKRKRKRRGKAKEMGSEEEGSDGENAPVDEEPPTVPLPLPSIAVDPCSSPSKQPLRPVLSAPSIFASSTQVFPRPFPTTQLSTQASPAKRLPLRATQSAVSVASESVVLERPKKRRKLAVINSPINIIFDRHRMYHNRLARTKKGLPYGLPAKHVLTRLPALFPSLSTLASAPPASKTHAEAPARHLAKYIFPRQFGLHNPFTVPKPRSSFEVIPDYLDREVEIKKLGAVKTPARLKPALESLTRLAILSQRCNYRKLLDRHCPSKMTHKRLDDFEKSAVLDLTSEPRTQNSRDNLSIDISQASSILPTNRSFPAPRPDAKPKLTEYACSFYEVDCFVQAVVEQVIPRSFWGSTANYKLIRSHISSFIRLRRFESTSLHALLQGFSILDCAWLEPSSASHKGQELQKPNAQDMEKRRELLSDFLFWFMDGFLLDLLRTTFYVTNAATQANRPLYYRQDDWNALCEPLLESLANTVFERVPANQLIPLQHKRELGFSYVRLLPKEAGVRPIVNLARRPLKVGLNGQKEVGRPINKILQSVFDVLTFERKRKPHLVGSLVSDPYEIFAKLKTFKTRLHEENGGKLPKLYFVKVDVRACYDTIQQDKLLEIMEDVLSETVYWVQKYSKVTPFGHRASKHWRRQACTDGDLGLFEELAEKLAEELHNAVLSDQVVYDRAIRDKLMELLREHITTNLVKVGGNLYRQKNGIPQGSVLSSLLCSLFYGDMERKKLAFTRSPDSVLLRYVDDFLFISTQQDRAVRFLRTMNDGIPEYGCEISADKRLTNFDVSLTEGEVVPPLPDKQDFPWCGLAINPCTLDVQFAAQSQLDKDIVDQLTIQRNRKPGKAFINAMFRAVKVRSHALYSDTTYNSSTTAYTNIYRAMLVVALKFQAYVQEWGVDARAKSGFLLQSVRQIVSFGYASLVHRARARKARLLKVEFTLKREWVIWLSYHAFHRVLSRRPSTYSTLLHALDIELKRPGTALIKKRLAPILAGKEMVFADRTNGVRKARRA